MELTDPERSWQVFVMLESFTDGFGGWKFMDVLGKPLAALPDWLIQDLSTWRWVAGIVKTQNRMIESGQDPFAASPALDLNNILGKGEN